MSTVVIPILAQGTLAEYQQSTVIHPSWRIVRVIDGNKIYQVFPDGVSPLNTLPLVPINPAALGLGNPNDLQTNVKIVVDAINEVKAANILPDPTGKEGWILGVGPDGAYLLTNLLENVTFDILGDVPSISATSFPDTAAMVAARADLQARAIYKAGNVFYVYKGTNVGTLAGDFDPLSTGGEGAAQQIVGSFSPPTQVSLSINPATVVKALTGLELGINTNYLTDGGWLGERDSDNVLKAMGEMGVRAIRYPGGEKSDNYYFSAAPWKWSSPRTITTQWPATETEFFSNQIGNEKVLDFDTYISMCRGCGAEPFVVVPYDVAYNTTGGLAKPTVATLVTHAAEWVRYANIVKGYGVKYWTVGNETWNSGSQNGTTTGANVATDFITFANAMKAIDPTIQMVANTQPGSYFTAITSNATALPLVDAIAFSNYVHQFANYEAYRTSSADLASFASTLNTAVNGLAEPHRSRIKLIASEFNATDFNLWNQNDMGHAVAIADTFGSLIGVSRLISAQFWGTRWNETTVATPQHIYDSIDKDGNLNATGKALKLWSKALGNELISATSPDAEVKVYATHDSVKKDVNVVICNRATSSKNIIINLNGYGSHVENSVRRFELKGTGASDKFPIFKDLGLMPLQSMTIPAISVTLLKLKRR